MNAAETPTDPQAESMDDFMARMETEHRASMTKPSEYSVASLKEVNTYNGVAWSASLRRAGKKIAEVSNDGNGGSNMYYFTDRAERDAFKAAADERYTGYETDDSFVDDLCTAFTLAKTSAPISFITDEVVLSRGEHLSFKKGPTFAQIAHHLATSADYVGKNPLIFDKTQRIFVNPATA